MKQRVTVMGRWTGKPVFASTHSQREDVALDEQHRQAFGIFTRYRVKDGWAKAQIMWHAIRWGSKWAVYGELRDIEKAAVAKQLGGAA